MRPKVTMLYVTMFDKAKRQVGALQCVPTLRSHSP